ncbi:hypothetical protein AALA82_18555, partial [Oscillospiraceae bacterium 50-16]
MVQNIESRYTNYGTGACYLCVTTDPVFPGFERFQKFSKALNFKGCNGLKIELNHDIIVLKRSRRAEKWQESSIDTTSAT